MIDQNPAPPSQDPIPRSSTFAKLRVAILLVVLVALVGILYVLWSVLQTQQRADYVISGEDLFNSGIIDRIIKRGPSQPVPTSDPTAQSPGVTQPRSVADLPPEDRRPPSPIAQGEQTYFLRTSGTGPKLTKLIISEFDPAIGERQAIQVEAESGQPIQSISVTLELDSGNHTLPLTLTQGSSTKGSWTAEWTINDTHDYIYGMILTATSPGAPNSSINLAFR